MHGLYTYQTVFSDICTIGPVLKELRMKGFCVPETDYFGLVELEPYKTIYKATPIKNGRQENPFMKAAEWSIDLRVDLYSLLDRNLPCGIAEPMVIDIASTLMGRQALENQAGGMDQERILAYETLQFIEATKNPKNMSSSEKKRQITQVAYLAYLK